MDENTEEVVPEVVLETVAPEETVEVAEEVVA
jgi:hypothetical protein